MKILPVRVFVVWGVLALSPFVATFAIPPLVPAMAQQLPVADVPEDVVEPDAAEPAAAPVAAAPAAPAVPGLADLVPVDPASIPFNPYFLAIILGAFAWMVVEGLKGWSARFAKAPTAVKASASVLVATLLGIGAHFLLKPTWSLWVSLLAGFIGGGGFSLIRGVGKGVRRVAVILVCLGVTQTACAHLDNLTPQQMTVVTASEECGTALLTEGLKCVKPCKTAVDVPACVNPCGVHLLHTSFPACVAAYDVLAGPVWEHRINTALALVLQLLDVLVPVPDPITLFPQSIPGGAGCG